MLMKTTHHFGTRSVFFLGTLLVLSLGGVAQLKSEVPCITDDYDIPCASGDCCGVGGGGHGGSGGGGPPGCLACRPDPVAKGVAMPVWRVSEPFLNLWIDDEPLGYEPSRGSRVSFKLSYKQRET